VLHAITQISCLNLAVAGADTNAGAEVEVNSGSGCAAAHTAGSTLPQFQIIAPNIHRKAPSN